MSLLDPLVAHAAVFNVQTGIPGPVDINNYGILGYIQNAYILALVFAGALALASIVYGAIQYTVSRGNPSKLADAWDRILQALIGILLLVGAGTILSIVNPGLLSLQLPAVLEAPSTGFDGLANRQGLGDKELETIGGSGAVPGLICNAAQAYYGADTSAGPSGGRLACAWAVSNVLVKAGLPGLNNSASGSEGLLRGGRGQLVTDLTQSKCGDIVVEAGGDHIGICIADGCGTVLSNSSSRASFVWRSSINFEPSYRSGPGRVYRVLR